MRPLDLDQARAIVELLGAPEHAPQTGLVRNYDRFDDPTHPLQAWTDEMFVNEDRAAALRKHFAYPRFVGQEYWREAWAYAIFRASWY